MSKQSFLLLTPLVCLFSVLLSSYQNTTNAALPSPVVGRNNTVLFLANAEHGFSNVHLATSFALLEHHPKITVHFASWDRIETKVNRMSVYARKKNPEAHHIKFHALPKSIPDISAASSRSSLEFMSPPGIPGLKNLTNDVQMFLAPWTAEDHLRLFNHVKALIAEIDPAVVVLDMTLGPALDATRNMNRLHAIITPSVLSDYFIGMQPFLGALWKYPATGSGYSFPVPWRSIPTNAYQAARFIYSVLFVPKVAEKRKFLAKHGIKDPINYMKIHQPTSIFMSQDTPGASIPLEYLPPNASATGPITVSVASAEEQDPELVEWLSRAPTILINLGSYMKFDSLRAAQMASAVKTVLERTGVQVLWKMLDPISCERREEDWRPQVEQFIQNDRLQVLNWLNVDPTALLQTGHIVVSVHHGGASCYHETVETGVPHIVLPAWVDLYNYAALVEALKIGIWGNKKTAPGISAEELSAALLKLIDGGNEALSIRNNAKRLAESIERPGREVAADKVAELAATGW